MTGIFLGDALRTFARLAPDSDADASAILDLLGLGDTLVAPRTGPPTATTAPLTASPLPAPALPGVPDRGASAPGREGRTVPSRVEVRDRAVAGAVMPGHDAEGLPHPTGSHPPPFEPLLRREWTRGVLFAASAALVDGEEVDVDLVVHEAAHGRAFTRLPRKPRWSTRHGAQLLIDFGPGTAPYRADRRWLEAAVGDVVGHDQVEVLRFSGDPSRAGSGARSTWRPHRPPPAGVPVLVFSDVTTFTRSADVGEWVRFADGVARAGCRLVLLTPASAPAALRGRAAVVPLDRGTTMAQVRDVVARVVGRT